MADITITITADEDDLRAEVAECTDDSSGPPTWTRRVRLARAVAAALPAPRLVVRPGMVLRRNSDGQRVLGHSRQSAPMIRFASGAALACLDGLDPDEWTVILDAEDA